MAGLEIDSFCHKTGAGGVYILQKWETGSRFWTTLSREMSGKYQETIYENPSRLTRKRTHDRAIADEL
jgi:hypothetical protein